jgi:hypothetical protein
MLNYQRVTIKNRDLIMGFIHGRKRNGISICKLQPIIYMGLLWDTILWSTSLYQPTNLFYGIFMGLNHQP